ncbi:eukaryotic translation elongation factor 1 delta a (guanine nucleotide exchange protein) isoform X1 [Hemibagrus wyckioides]|uniref:eukaryotic translation elongation factor 1 delta a (guanine nucleotide exchange protein) isoform X1 n=1 Tax=Hemibagrus wyckioides TaxID=337641 RepID=UPI00266C99DF|nr:eukaryotic translation elongation factor 1 delta a (guanine nucleotide exchange protein) isoform X1 [Hemibagrus wyckioides]
MDNQRGSQSHPREVGGPWQGSANNATHQNPHGGVRRRPQRSSHSESHASEEHLFFPETYGSVHGSRGEFVWFNSNMYEQAEDYFQSPPSSGTSPREQVVHRSLVFRAKKKPTRPSREEGNPVRSRSYSAQKNQRSSSEPQRGRRKRGYSETERPTPRKRDNIIMSGLQCLAQEKIWFDKSKYDEAERRFYEGINGVPSAPQETDANGFLQDMVKARQAIQQSLAGVKAALQSGKAHSRPQKPRERKSSQNASKSEDQSELVSRVKSLELDNKNLHKVVDDLRAMLSKLESRLSVLEKSPSQAPKAAVPQAAPAPSPKVVVKEEEEDDDIDLFGSDEEDEEAERIKAQRVQEYTAKKAKKPALIAKSSIILDVKPWDDETDMAKLEECVRSVQMDGLLWGASKLVPVGYGIKKLQINCVVEDDKVGVDILEEEITKFEDYVQSVDVAAFNKI